MKGNKGKKTKTDRIIKLVPPKLYSIEHGTSILDDKNLVSYEVKPKNK